MMKVCVALSMLIGVAGCQQQYTLKAQDWYEETCYSIAYDAVKHECDNREDCNESYANFRIESHKSVCEYTNRERSREAEDDMISEVNKYAKMRIDCAQELFDDHCAYDLCDDLTEQQRSSLFIDMEVECIKKLDL